MTDEFDLTTEPVEGIEAEAPSVVEDDSPSKIAAREILEAAGDDDIDEAEKEVPEATAATPEDSEEGGDADSEAETEEKEAPTPVQILKAKVGDKEMDLPDDAVITVKVNKKDEEVSIRDLKRNYQGKIPWEKHYQETVEKERQLKQWEVEVNARHANFQKANNDYQSFVENMVEEAKKNPSEALIKACIKVGKSPNDVLKSIIQQSRATAESLEGMDEEKLGLLLTKKSLEYERTLLENERQKEASTKQQQQELASLDGHIQTRLSRDGVSVEDYLKSQDALTDAVKQRAVDISTFTPVQIADLIIEQVLQFDRPRGRIAKALSTLAPDKAGDAQFIAQLHQHLGGGHLTNFKDEDLNYIMKGIFESNGAPKGSEPVQAEVTTDSSKGRAGSPTPPKIPQKEAEPRMEAGDDDDFDPLSMEELLDHFRNKRA